MKFGLFHMNTGCCSYPDGAATIARSAEDAGFESLWVSEHIALPDPPAPHFPVDPRSRRLDPLIALTFLAAQTETVMLGTGVVILPQRNPLILAKELASLDLLSDGRLIFGFGVGHLKPEVEALGVPFHERGSRTDEYLAAMTSLWQDEQPTFKGQFVDFTNMHSHPQRDVQLVVGGYAPAALRRTVRYAHGWYGFNGTIEKTREDLSKLATAAQEVKRPSVLGELEISVSPPKGPIDRATVEQYADLGVHRLILLPPSDKLDERMRFIDSIHKELL